MATGMIRQARRTMRCSPAFLSNRIDGRPAGTPKIKAGGQLLNPVNLSFAADVVNENQEDQCQNAKLPRQVGDQTAKCHGGPAYCAKASGFADSLLYSHEVVRMWGPI